MKADLAAALARIEAKLDQLLTEQGVSYDMPARYTVEIPPTLSQPPAEAKQYDGPPLWDDDETGTGGLRMSTALAKRTWADIVNSVAWNFGQNLTARQAEDLLWGYTGFPCFWRGEPEASARKQLWDYFVAQSFGCLPCMRCGSDAASDMCEPCRSVVDAEIAVEAK